MTALGSWLRDVWFALVFLAGVVLLHVILGDEEQVFVEPLLIAAPALAAATSTLWGVAAVGVLVLAARQFLLVFDSAADELADLRIFETRTLGYLAVIAVSMYLAHRRQQRDEKLSALTSVALTAEETILRPLPREIDGVRVGVRYIAAADEAVVGGDLYEVVSTEFGVRAIVGDVKGSGLGTVYAASVVLGAFRAVAYEEPDLVAVSSRVERTASRYVSGDDFVTVLLVEVGKEDVRFVHRGHVPPLVVSASGEVRSVMPPVAGPPLGLGHLADVEIRPWTVPLGAGETLVLYTDGVTEARSGEVFYPLVERVAALVDTDVDASAERLRADVVQFVGRALLDDAVFLLLSRG